MVPNRYTITHNLLLFLGKLAKDDSAQPFLENN